VLLIFVAAGLIVFAIDELMEAGILAQGAVLFDISHILPDESGLGSILHSLFGYVPDPTLLQVALYLLYLIPVLVLFLFDDRLPKRQPANAA